MESGRESLFLDTVSPRWATVGYGGLGRQGSLGYEDKQVTAGGRTWESALSTHPPSRLVFDLEGRFARFHCQVAINDDVPAGASEADFSVLADGRRVAAVRVVAGEPPRVLTSDVHGARRLELRVDTLRWPYCHAVWLEPCLEAGSVGGPLIDCLGRAEILLPDVPLRGERCIATLVSPGFEIHLDDMLGSLFANGGCPSTLVVVFAIGESAEIDRLAAKYRVPLVRCRTQSAVSSVLKGILYSVARVIEAEKFLCLDADMLVLGDLDPLFAALDACPEGALLACREWNGNWHKDLTDALCTSYCGREADLRRLLGEIDGEGSYPLVINSGLLAGSRAAMLALDACLRDMSDARAWMDERPDIVWRDQFLVNLAMAHLRCGVELDPVYNLQLHIQDVEIGIERGRLQARWNGREVKILHFHGYGRGKYPEFRGLFARVPDPLLVGKDGDAYPAFLAALRAWIGRFGLQAAAWSFYSTSDARTARVRDPSTFPLLALLYDLIRANGCVRVVEAGTARGVSTACLASAVAHRDGARVVTFDPAPVDPRRDELWGALPEAVRACIEPHATGSLEGMAAALAAGERYDAALLDSLHTTEHVWQELQWASRLVRAGGLILIHDACVPEVEAALRRIAADGYGVTRLWAASEGVREDDGQGLAVIENRRREPGGTLA
jgi:predicted O-methyltransferase YrrM